MDNPIKAKKNTDEAVMLTLLTSIWRSFILCHDRAAMKDLNHFLGLLEDILPSLAVAELERITSVLPLLMQSMEQKNGMLIADILRFEIEPVLSAGYKGDL